MGVWLEETWPDGKGRNKEELGLRADLTYARQTCLPAGLALYWLDHWTMLVFIGS